MALENELNDLLDKFRRDLENFKNTKIKCGIIGRSGTGKSSLINAIVGEEIAEVGEVETTMEVGKPIEHKGLLFYDLPGCSTKNFPKETYFKKFNINEFDCVILATSERFYEDDLFLIEELSKINKPTYAVRTKIDYAIDRGTKRGKTEYDTLREIHSNLSENLTGYKVEGVYLTSADYPKEYDLGKLIDDIINSLVGLKKERFIADVSINSKKILEGKKAVAKKIVSRYSALAAANGFNPVPGLDISVDIGLLLKMGNEIRDIFGLTEKQQDFVKEYIDERTAKIISGKALQFTAKYIGKEAIILLLKKAASSQVTKNITKWIPFVGQIIAAGIGFLLTSSIGEGMIKDAEEIAKETFNAFKNAKVTV